MKQVLFPREQEGSGRTITLTSDQRRAAGVVVTGERAWEATAYGMRIVMVSDFVAPVRGGLETHVEGLSRELASRGHDVHVATLTSNPIAFADGVTVHSVPSIARGLPHERAERPFHPPVPDPLARLHLARLVDRLRPDILHGHNWLAVSAPRGPGWPPLVYTAHDYGLVCQLRTLLQPGLTRCSGPRPMKCLACGTRAHGIARTALLGPGTAVGRSMMRPDAVIAVSEAVASRLRPSIGAPVHVVPNFILPERPAPLPAPLPDRYVLYAGDPGFHKGVPDLLELWRTDPPDCALVLAVTRPLDSPVPPGVTVLSLSRAQVQTAMMGAVAALIPSVWDEPFALVALEAFAVGTPIVASRVGGLVDLVSRDVGFLVEPGRMADLRRCVDLIVANDTLRGRLSQACRAAAGRFELRHVANEILGVYDSVLATGPGSSHRRPP